jgi:hypothetical protein
MKYIGNCKEWIQPEWIDRILNTDGDVSPLHQPHNQIGELPEQKELYANFCRAGYDKRNFYVNMYSGGKTKDVLDFNVQPPDLIDMTGKVWHWWFIKTMPGQLSHWHFDPHTVFCKNAERYCIALHDYEPGQIFTWEGGHLHTNFVAGDVFKFDYPHIMHGTANISMSPRYNFQCTVYEPGTIDNYDKKFYKKNQE